MSKCIFFCVPAQGHVNPQLALVDALVKKGEEVIYYCAPAFKEKIEKTGAEFRLLTTKYDRYIDEFGLIVGLNIVQIERLLMDVSNDIIAGLSGIVRDEKPDYIISDVITYYGAAAAHANKVPLITFFPVFCVTRGITGSLPLSFMLRILGQVISAPNHLIRLLKGAARLNKYMGDYPVSLQNAASHGSEMNIVSIPGFFQFRADAFAKDKYIFTGPMLYYKRETPDFPVENAAGKKFIYISLGTVYNKRPKFFAQCFKAFEKTDYRVIMSMPEAITRGLKDKIPDNFIVRPYVPQLQVLQYVDAFISHGGMNSVQESLYFGVPMVIIPQSTDQYLNGFRLARLGAGICLKKETPDAKELLSAVEKVIANTAYKDRAKELSGMSKSAGGVEAAVKAIEGFKEKHNIL